MRPSFPKAAFMASAFALLAAFAPLRSFAAPASPDVQTQERRSSTSRYILYAVVPLIIVVDGLLIWAFLLNRQVKRKSKDLQESRHNYRLLFEGVSDGMILCDERGRIVESNKSAANMFGCGRPDLSGKKMEDIFGPSANDVVMESQSRPVERMIDSSGVHVELTSTPVAAERRKFTLVMARDITERKRAEQLKADVDRMARHDLKSPLNGILAIPDMIREDGGLNGRQLELLKLLEESGCQMLNMINLSADIFKLERGVYEFRPASVNLFPVLRKILLETQSLAGMKKLAVELFMDGKPAHEKAAARIWGEEILCHSMLSNLVKNAIEASPENASVQICLLREGDMQLVEIRNRGAVPRDLRDKFFEKYATHGKAGGSGLAG